MNWKVFIIWKSFILTMAIETIEIVFKIFVKKNWKNEQFDDVWNYSDR